MQDICLDFLRSLLSPNNKKSPCLRASESPPLGLSHNKPTVIPAMCSFSCFLFSLLVSSCGIHSKDQCL